MPLVIKPPVRKDFKPIVFFKGTLQQARRLPEQRIVEAFEAVGADKERNSLELALGVKQELLKVVSEMQKTGESNYIVPVQTPFGLVPFKIKSFENGTLLVHQMPLLHNVTPGRDSADPFVALQAIVKNGFVGEENPNVLIKESKDVVPAYVSARSRRELPATGDLFAIRLMAPIKDFVRRKYQPFWGIPHDEHLAFVEKASPSQVIGISILLDPSASEKEIEEKKTIYKKVFEGHPIFFH